MRRVNHRVCDGSRHSRVGHTATRVVERVGHLKLTLGMPPLGDTMMSALCIWSEKNRSLRSISSHRFTCRLSLLWGALSPSPTLNVGVVSHPSLLLHAGVAHAIFDYPTPVPVE